MDEATRHVYALLLAMEAWGREFDGISCRAWPAYRAAREFVGQPVPEKSPRECDERGSDLSEPYAPTKVPEGVIDANLR